MVIVGGGLCPAPWRSSSSNWWWTRTPCRCGRTNWQAAVGRPPCVMPGLRRLQKASRGSAPLLLWSWHGGERCYRACRRPWYGCILPRCSPWRRTEGAWRRRCRRASAQLRSPVLLRCRQERPRRWRRWSILCCVCCRGMMSPQQAGVGGSRSSGPLLLTKSKAFVRSIKAT